MQYGIYNLLQNKLGKVKKKQVKSAKARKVWSVDLRGNGGKIVH